MEYTTIRRTATGKWKFVDDSKTTWVNNSDDLDGEIVSRLSDASLSDEAIGLVVTGEEEYAIIYETKKGKWKFVNYIVYIDDNGGDVWHAWHTNARLIQHQCKELQAVFPNRQYEIITRQNTYVV